MNKIYRLIWSKKSNSLVAVSEAAKSKRQGSSPSKSQLVGAVAAALLSLSSGIDKAQALTNTDSTGGFDVSHDNEIYNFGIISAPGSGILNSNIDDSNVATFIYNADGLFGPDFIRIGIYASTYGIQIQGNPSADSSRAYYYPGLAGSINNQGVIEAGNAGIYIEAGSVGGILNGLSGVINSVSASGIHIKQGVLSGVTENSNSWYVTQASTVASIANYGQILAADVGIKVMASTVTGSIQNVSYGNPLLGSIAAGNNGIYLGGSALISPGGGISNTGIIAVAVSGGITLNDSSIISERF
jgi:hypothetical protein